MTAPLPDGVYPEPVVYGPDGPGEDELAELFHEASKFYPSTAARLASGGRRLERSADLRAATLRAGMRNRHLPRIALPEAADLAAPLGTLLRSRRSCADFDGEGISLGELATLLHAAYGVTRAEPSADGTRRRRSVPSGGALYPLELYVAARRVDGLESAVYHYDPLDEALERLPLTDVDAGLGAAVMYPHALERAAATVVLTAVFRRTRVKYGLRGYRFALLEAGHAMQNLLLAATGCGLAALPLGGFFDRRIDELLGVNGVDESVVYAAHVGRGSR